MKILILLICLLPCSIVHAQNEYYTTDGKNRMDFEEIEDIRLGLKDKMAKVMKQPMDVTLVIDESTTFGDSIIHMVTLDASIKKEVETVDPSEQFGLEGKELPKFELQDLEGNKVDLTDLKGKPSLINFWFTGCAPCIEEMPILNNLVSQYKEKVNFIAITFESSSRVNRFLERKQFDFLHLVDAQAYIKELGFNEFPKNIFLDKHGIVTSVNAGIPYQKTESGSLEISEGQEFIQIINDLLIK